MRAVCTGEIHTDIYRYIYLW